MKISVIIVAYKSGDILVKCLDSIAKYNDIEDELEVIVVDNSPEDERIERDLAKSQYKNYRYIPSDNRGFGAGNNQGVDISTGEILAFLNPDIMLIEPIFKKVWEKFQKEKDLMLMGGKLLFEDLKPGFSFYFDYKPSIIKKWSLKLWNRKDRYDEKNMYIAGADLFVRRDAFYEAGKFDENIFMYYEEPDLIRRLRKVQKDCKIVYEPGIRMIHLEKKSTPMSMKMIGHEMDSCIYYGKKYGLDYKKKIRFEYRYYKLKKMIYRVLKNQKAERMNEIIQYLNENYIKILRKY